MTNFLMIYAALAAAAAIGICLVGWRWEADKRRRDDAIRARQAAGDTTPQLMTDAEVEAFDMENARQAAAAALPGATTAGDVQRILTADIEAQNGLEHESGAPFTLADLDDEPLIDTEELERRAKIDAEHFTRTAIDLEKREDPEIETVSIPEMMRRLKDQGKIGVISHETATPQIVASYPDPDAAVDLPDGLEEAAKRGLAMKNPERVWKACEHAGVEDGAQIAVSTRVTGDAEVKAKVVRRGAGGRFVKRSETAARVEVVPALNQH